VQADLAVRHRAVPSRATGRGAPAHGERVARSSTPLSSLSVAPKSTCPQSLLTAPVLGKTNLGGGTTITFISSDLIVRPSARRVPVRATRRSEPRDHAKRAVSCRPFAALMVSSVALKTTSPELLM